jgi:8-oxo-dGTP pyrophosphatase MutT (NUDIX family)
LVLKYPSGHYDFPKGHQEAGETEVQTLLREVEEETGLTNLYVINQKQTIKYYYRAKGNEHRKRKRSGKGSMVFKLVHFYPAEVNFAPVTLSDEHIGFKWMSYQKARRRVTFENAKKVLDIAARAEARIT